MIKVDSCRRLGVVAAAQRAVGAQVGGGGLGGQLGLPGSAFHPAGPPFHPAGPLFHPVGPLFRPTGPPFHPLRSAVTPSLVRRSTTLVRRSTHLGSCSAVLVLGVPPTWADAAPAESPFGPFGPFLMALCPCPNSSKARQRGPARLAPQGRSIQHNTVIHSPCMAHNILCLVRLRLPLHTKMLWRFTLNAHI